MATNEEILKPQALVLPSIPASSQLTTAPVGDIGMSGASLVYFNGTNWATTGATDLSAYSTTAQISGSFLQISQSGAFLTTTTADNRYLQLSGGSLLSGVYASDHGFSGSAMLVNVCYGLSATPPTASTTTEGALYIQYKA